MFSTVYSCRWLCRAAFLFHFILFCVPFHYYLFLFGVLNRVFALVWREILSSTCVYILHMTFHTEIKKKNKYPIWLFPAHALSAQRMGIVIGADTNFALS